MKIIINDIALSETASESLLAEFRKIYDDKDMNYEKAQEIVKVKNYSVNGDYLTIKSFNYINKNFDIKRRLYIIRDNEKNIIGFKIIKEAVAELTLYKLLELFPDDPINNIFVRMLEAGVYDYNIIDDYIFKKCYKTLMFRSLTNLN
jgi:hypothetical protein